MLPSGKLPPTLVSTVPLLFPPVNGTNAVERGLKAATTCSSNSTDEGIGIRLALLFTKGANMAHTRRGLRRVSAYASDFAGQALVDGFRSGAGDRDHPHRTPAPFFLFCQRAADEAPEIGFRDRLVKARETADARDPDFSGDRAHSGARAHVRDSARRDVSCLGVGRHRRHRMAIYRAGALPL